MSKEVRKIVEIKIKASKGPMIPSKAKLKKYVIELCNLLSKYEITS